MKSIDVKKIRQNLSYTQAQFARVMEVSLRTLQNWEQGHRRPTGPAKRLLMVIAVNPKAVINALRSYHKQTEDK